MSQRFDATLFERCVTTLVKSWLVANRQPEWALRPGDEDDGQRLADELASLALANIELPTGVLPDVVVPAREGVAQAWKEDLLYCPHVRGFRSGSFGPSGETSVCSGCGAMFVH